MLTLVLWILGWTEMSAFTATVLDTFAGNGLNWMMVCVGQWMTQSDANCATESTTIQRSTVCMTERMQSGSSSRLFAEVDTSLMNMLVSE